MSEGFVVLPRLSCRISRRPHWCMSPRCRWSPPPRHPARRCSAADRDGGQGGRAGDTSRPRQGGGAWESRQAACEVRAANWHRRYGRAGALKDRQTAGRGAPLPLNLVSKRVSISGISLLQHAARLRRQQSTLLASDSVILGCDFMWPLNKYYLQI